MTAAALWLCLRVLVRDHRTPLVRCERPHLARGL